jgi:hypothetical protein
MVPWAATAPGPRQAPLKQHADLLLLGDAIPWLCILAAAAVGQGERETPQGIISLFEVGFLNSLGALAAPATSMLVSNGMSPFDTPGKQQQQALMHALRSVHVVSPHGIEFTTEQQQQQAYPKQMQQQHYLEDRPSYRSPHPMMSYVEFSLYADNGSQQQQCMEEHAQGESDGEQELAYPPFKIPTEKMHFASNLRLLIEMSTPSASASYNVEMSAFNSYVSEFSV